MQTHTCRGTQRPTGLSCTQRWFVNKNTSKHKENPAKEHAGPYIQEWVRKNQCSREHLILTFTGDNSQLSILQRG